MFASLWAQTCTFAGHWSGMLLYLMNLCTCLLLADRKFCLFKSSSFPGNWELVAGYKCQKAGFYINGVQRQSRDHWRVKPKGKGLQCLDMIKACIGVKGLQSTLPGSRTLNLRRGEQKPASPLPLFSPKDFSPTDFSPICFSPTYFSPVYCSPIYVSPTECSTVYFSPIDFHPYTFRPQTFRPQTFHPQTLHLRLCTHTRLTHILFTHRLFAHRLSPIYLVNIHVQYSVVHVYTIHGCVLSRPWAWPWVQLSPEEKMQWVRDTQFGDNRGREQLKGSTIGAVKLYMVAEQWSW